MARITRRAALGAAAAVGASALARAGGEANARRASRKSGSPRDARADVIVVGAGLSGLSSAMLLEEAGLDVQVIEARDRVGGRVFTRFELPGFPEVGGNTFAAGYGRVLDRARRLGLPLAEYSARRMKYSKTELVVDGSLVPSGSWASSPLNTLPEGYRERMPWELSRVAMKGRSPLTDAQQWRTPAMRPYDISIHDFLSERGVPEEVIRQGFSVNQYFGTSAYDVSALMYAFNDAWIDAQALISNHQYSIAGGNQQLPMAMSKSLKRPVDLGREVVAISSDRSGAEVRCRDGSRYRGQRVICSLPYSVVRNIQFDPVLRGTHARAVSSLQYMINTIIFLHPTRPFWERDGLSPAMWSNGLWGSVRAERFGESDEEVTCLVVNPRGHRAAYLDRLPRDQAIGLVIREIEQLRPAARGALRCTGYHSWHQDPYAAGDWAIYGPGQVLGLAEGMAAIHERVHFCGEHTAAANRGMEAAMESAERASIEVIGAL